jgi:hypothetical protein
MHALTLICSKFRYEYNLEVIWNCFCHVFEVCINCLHIMIMSYLLLTKHECISLLSFRSLLLDKTNLFARVLT